MLKRPFNQAWRAFVHSMWYTFGAGSSTSFVGKERRSGCLIPFVPFKNVFYMVNTSLTCCMNIRKYVRSLLIDGLMDVHDLHSYVLLFLCLDYLFASCLWRYKLPGPGQGWRVGGTVLHLVGVCFLQTEEHKNKRFHWMLECAFKRTWHTLFHSMIASEMLRPRLTFVGEEHKGITLLIMLSCHSWQGPGIWSLDLYNALVGVCVSIEIRSLVLARDDGLWALCFFYGCMLFTDRRT